MLQLSRCNLNMAPETVAAGAHETLLRQQCANTPVMRSMAILSSDTRRRFSKVEKKCLVLDCEQTPETLPSLGGVGKSDSSTLFSQVSHLMLHPMCGLSCKTRQCRPSLNGTLAPRGIKLTLTPFRVKHERNKSHHDEARRSVRVLSTLKAVFACFSKRTSVPCRPAMSCAITGFQDLSLIV